MANAAALHDRPMTADEFYRMPDDGVRRELVRGEVRVTSPGGRSHSRIGLRIGGRLDRYVVEHGLGEAYGSDAGFRIHSDPDTVLCPDAAFVRADRLTGCSEDSILPLTPDLAVEVMSPRDTFAAAKAKAFVWLSAGCGMVVVVSPRRRTATVYRSPDDVTLLTESDVLDGGDVVPGWTLPLSELFA
ncbi:MAG TPA: Uma2 family endonuclease [Longimicrobium sp.]|nr:Uma2 family endonuclease [Longimicrobium sp.]